MKGFTMYFSLFMTYCVNLLKRIFKPDPDLRLKFEYDHSSGLMRNKIGEFLFPLILSNEFNIFIKHNGNKIEVMNVESEHQPGMKIFYGLPIVSENNMQIVITTYSDDIVHNCKNNSVIPYDKILEKL